MQKLIFMSLLIQVVFCGAQVLFLRWHGATWGVRGVLGVVGDAHIRARGQLTASCCGVILGRISRLGCGPAPGNPHTREAELRGI